MGLYDGSINSTGHGMTASDLAQAGTQTGGFFIMYICHEFFPFLINLHGEKTFFLPAFTQIFTKKFFIQQFLVFIS